MNPFLRDFQGGFRKLGLAVGREEADLPALWLGGLPQSGPAVSIWGREPRPAAARSLNTVIFLSFSECQNSLRGAGLAGAWRNAWFRADALTLRWVVVRHYPVASGCSRAPQPWRWRHTRVASALCAQRPHTVHAENFWGRGCPVKHRPSPQRPSAWLRVASFPGVVALRGHLQLA